LYAGDEAEKCSGELGYVKRGGSSINGDLLGLAWVTPKGRTLRGG
jgi:hypothetical protein